MPAVKTSGLERFIEHLRMLHIRELRGPMAHLRRGLNKPPGAVAKACPHVLPFVGGSGPPHRESVFFRLGSLFALHPCIEGKSMGAVFLQLNPRGDENSTNHRFLQLLSSDWEELERHLISAVRLAKQGSVPIDYFQLGKDLIGWNHEDRYVQMRWSRDYWGSWDVPVDPEET